MWIDKRAQKGDLTHLFHRVSSVLDCIQDRAAGVLLKDFILFGSARRLFDRKYKTCSFSKAKSSSGNSEYVPPKQTTSTTRENL